MEHTVDNNHEEWKDISNISSLIQVLDDIKKKHGDLPVHSAYDGDWWIPASVDLLFYEKPHVVIGGLS